MRVHLVRLRPREGRDEADPKPQGRASVARRRLGYIRGMTEVIIKTRANGPYKVEGPVRVIDSEGNEFELPEGSAIVLCRCGHSQTKPFCDSSHKRVGFVADDVALRASRGQTRRA